MLIRWLILASLLGACSSPASPADPQPSPAEDTAAVPDHGPGAETDVTDSDSAAATDEGPDPTDVPKAEDDGPPTDTGGGDGCQQDCANKECGPDGCGGLCGFCVFGEMCSTLFQCVPDCEAQCDGKFCGPDGCGGACGTCPGGFECGTDGKCYDVACTPDCTGKVCGSDGCTGDCGACTAGDICEDGACVVGPCSGIPPEGKCDGDVSLHCIDGQPAAQDCAAIPGADKDCAWDPTEGSYGCVEASDCVPVCTGKQCGSDGCNGQCGVCPSEWPCAAGQCEPAQGGACGFINAVGKCIEGVLWYCNDTQLLMQDCPGVGLICGYDPDAKKNTCL